MDEDTGRILSKILGKRELDKIPPDIVKKLEKYFDHRFEEFLTTKARYETSQHNIGKHFKLFNFYAKQEKCIPQCRPKSAIIIIVAVCN